MLLSSNTQPMVLLQICLMSVPSNPSFTDGSTGSPAKTVAAKKPVQSEKKVESNKKPKAPLPKHQRQNH